jgi:hypothetical protein
MRDPQNGWFIMENNPVKHDHDLQWDLGFPNLETTSRTSFHEILVGYERDSHTK